MVRILIVEDEESILLGLEDDLKLEGYDVSSATDGEQGLSKAREAAHDLMILDVMLPKIDGFEVCRQLRQAGVTTPILMLTAKGQEIDRVLGLELGADDYVTKPFSPRELLARVKAILRRTSAAEPAPSTYAFGNVEVDFRRHEVTRDGEPIHFTALEFSLLQFLIERRDEALTRDAILTAVWGEDVCVYPRTVDAHIGHLRKKVEVDLSKPAFIVGVRGVGYRFMG
jgi:DNA-binding response OmpR family regulator